MLIVLLALAVLAVLLLVAYGLGEVLTRPVALRPVGPDPDALGLPFEWITFGSHDGKRLLGWLVGPELARPPVVILHGYTDNKSSYLDQARFLYEHGYPSLLYDQRGHGESAPARITLGVLESLDLVEALGELERRGRGERFVVWGVSMGAATALLAAARTDRIAGVVAESSFDRIDRVVADTLRLRLGLPLPAFPFVSCGLLAASLLSGARLAGVDVAAAVAALGDRPLLVVSGGRDARMPPRVGERLLRHHPRGWSAHLVVDEADHAECWRLGRDRYGPKVLELLEVALAGATG